MLRLVREHPDGSNGVPWNAKMLSSNESLTLEVIAENPHLDWDWNYLSRYLSFSRPGGSTIDNNLSSMSLIEKYEDRWDWSHLSGNRSLPWTVELLEKYVDRWDWSRLSHNQSLPWTVELLEKYVDRWDWYELSCNSSIPYEIILSTPDLPWNSDGLSRRYYLPSTRGRMTKSAMKR